MIVWVWAFLETAQQVGNVARAYSSSWAHGFIGRCRYPLQHEQMYCQLCQPVPQYIMVLICLFKPYQNVRWYCNNCFSARNASLFNMHKMWGLLQHSKRFVLWLARGCPSLDRGFLWIQSWKFSSLASEPYQVRKGSKRNLVFVDRQPRK